MPLTHAQIENTKPQGKPIRLFDGRGLYLEIAPRGGRWWRFKYRFAGKERRVSLGVDPEIGLKAARDRLDSVRKLVAAGVDPGEQRKAATLTADAGTEHTFEAVAREWFRMRSAKWAKGHADRIIQRLERDVFPWLGSRSIRDVTAPELLSVIRRIEARRAIETAHRAMQNCSQIFRYAVAIARATRDITTDLRGAVAPAVEKHHPSITVPKAVGALLRAIRGYQGSFVTQSSLRLAPLVFVRPGELRKAEWSELDLDAAEWRIPGQRMKSRRHHIVPLSSQAVAILRELQPLTGNYRYVFPGDYNRDRCMSENTVTAALRRLGYSGDQIRCAGR